MPGGGQGKERVGGGREQARRTWGGSTLPGRMRSGGPSKVVAAGGPDKKESELTNTVSGESFGSKHVLPKLTCH